MKSYYKKLGQFIKEVSVKNKKLNVELLLGVSITKKFIPSIANTVGTDMSKYKIVKKHQFAYGPVTSRNGEKISVALLFKNECLVSTSYTVFEIIDKKSLDPEYLMMWFCRSEFDRYARYMSHGTVREIFGWQEMCDIELPIPPIEKQREVVREYNTVNDRIKLNEKITQKLEETAQAIYKQWFVDFEFPMTKEYAKSIGKPELEGKPYKSSGGKMVYCDELYKDIPNNFIFSKIGSFVALTQGQVINSTTNHMISDHGFPLLRIQDLKSGEQCVFINDSVPKTKISNKNDIIVSRTAIVGLVFRGVIGVVHNNCFIVKSTSPKLTSDYLFYYLKSSDIYLKMIALASGSVQHDLSHDKFKGIPIYIPPLSIQINLSSILKKIENLKKLQETQHKLLKKFKNILLSKLSKV